MKIYTKILIGMAVGAVIGIALGPKSDFLAHDYYDVGDVQAITLLLDRDDPNSKIDFPAVGGTALAIGLEILETETIQVPDKAGGVRELPKKARVRFAFSERMSIADSSGQLAASLQKHTQARLHVGSKIEAWLVLEHTLLESGDILVSPVPVSSIGVTLLNWISPVGLLFMRLIKMVIVPLVFASLLVGVASLGDVRKLGRLGGRTIVLYLVSTAVAVTVGLVLAHIVQPGSFVDESDRATLVASYSSSASSKVSAAASAPTAVENILAIIPTNIVESLADGAMLPIIFFAFIFGVALTLLEPERTRPVVAFFDTVQHAMVLIIHMVMATAPFGVAALIAEAIGQSGASVLGALLVYAATVLGGLLIFGVGFYGTLVRVLAKLPFVQFLKAARPAQLIAFSTSSSSATLPVTMECAEENLGISPSVASFVLPLGSTVNMDGTALYQGVAAIFIAQVFQVDLSLFDQLGIVLAATAGSIGAAGVPGAGIFTLALVLTSAGIPMVGVALILGMDRILDMFRTAINVTGDLAVASVMAVLEGETLHPLTPDEDAQDPSRGFEGRV